MTGFGFGTSFLLLSACATPVTVDPGEAPVGADPTAVVRISELMARNQTTLQDSTGHWSDWIELANPGDSLVNLEDWTVTDSSDGDDRFVLSGLTIAPQGTLLLWADGATERGADHLPFSLDSDGESFAIYRPDGELVDGLTFGALPADVSLGRTEENAWTFLKPPTPGLAPILPAGPQEWAAPGHPCGLRSDLQNLNVLEGDTVQFTVTCTENPATLTPIDFPRSSTWDAENRRFSWSTGPADGGRIDLLFAVSDGSSPIPHAEQISFWLADNPAAWNNQRVDPLRYTEEWGLPVLHLTTEGTPTTSTEVPSTVTWEGRRYVATTEVHGQTSSHYTKLAYEVNLEEEKLPVEAWDTDVRHLLLLSTFDDNSYVRQKLVYDTWQAMGDSANQRLGPSPFFLVLYLNGVYHGLYLGQEKVDDDFLERRGFAEETSLYKAAEATANYGLTDYDGNPKLTFHDGFEKIEGLPEDDFSDLDRFLSFTAESSTEKLLSDASRWMSWSEFLDWYLLIRYTNAEDSTCKNHFLVGSDGKFKVVPWDFNASWGQNWRTYRVSPSFNDDFALDNHLFAVMQADPGSQAAFWSRYAALRENGPLSLDWQISTLDSYYVQIEPSAQRDWEKWGDAYRSYESWAAGRDSKADWNSFSEEKAYLYQWVTERAELFPTFAP